MFAKIANGAVVPTRATKESAGYDLAAYGDHILHAGINKVRTGVMVAIPVDYYGQIALRSGFSLRSGCIVTAGVIDSDYRGEIMVILHSPGEFELKNGVKFAQLLVIRNAKPALLVVDTLPAADQEHLGFGSTDFKPLEPTPIVMQPVTPPVEQPAVIQPVEQPVTSPAVEQPVVIQPAVDQLVPQDNVSDSLEDILANLLKSESSN